MANIRLAAVVMSTACHLIAAADVDICADDTCGESMNLLQAQAARHESSSDGASVSPHTGPGTYKPAQESGKQMCDGICRQMDCKDGECSFKAFPWKGFFSVGKSCGEL